MNPSLGWICHKDWWWYVYRYVWNLSYYQVSVQVNISVSFHFLICMIHIILFNLSNFTLHVIKYTMTCIWNFGFKFKSSGRDHFSVHRGHLFNVKVLAKTQKLIRSKVKLKEEKGYEVQVIRWSSIECQLWRRTSKSLHWGNLIKTI